MSASPAALESGSIRRLSQRHRRKRTTFDATNMPNRPLLFLIIVSIGALGYINGFMQYLDPDDMRELIRGLGVWGPGSVIVLFSLSQPFGFPGAIFMMASSTLWPFWLAFPVNLLGAVGAGMVGFGFARYLGRDWVEDRMPERIRAWDERLSAHGLPVVISFRLLFFITPPAHWALGLSRVRVHHAVIGSFIGLAPGVALWTYFGGEILEWLEAQTAEVWIGLLLLTFAAIVVARYRKRRHRERSSPNDPSADEARGDD